MTMRTVRLLFCVAIAVAMATSGTVQQQSDRQADSALEALRADLRADKVAIVTEAMRLTPAEADKFWPVYREYEAEVVKLNDQRIALFKDYSQKYVNLTDSDAKAMGDKFLTLETDRTKLRKTYFDKLSKATSATTALKFFQVEHRLDLVVDLQLAAEVPGLFMKSAKASQ